MTVRVSMPIGQVCYLALHSNITFIVTMSYVPDDRALWLARNILPHEPALRAQLRRWSRATAADVDDIVQEAYGRLAGMESVDQIRNPRAYLFSVARTIVLMQVRRDRIVSIRAFEDADAWSLAADDPSPEDQVSDREQLHLLALAIAALPEPGRRAFMMRMIDELPYRAIGDALGLSDNAVQKSVAKSLVRLMSALGRGANRTPRTSRQEQVAHSKEAHALTRDQRGD